MITICLLITVCGIAVLCLCAALWDTLEPWVQRIIRSAKRGLCARWLAEEGLTVTPLEPKTGIVPRVGFDEMMDIIKGV